MDAEHARQLIVSEKERLENLIRDRETETGIGTESENASISELSSLDQHQGDIGTETFEREKDFSILEQVEAELHDVQRALQRLDDGTYGKCEACNQPIGDERLAALPAARFCVQHQSEAEATAS
jgi:RNA polymerase-binding transcription factor DksA